MEIDKIKRALDKNSKTLESEKWTPETITIARKAIITGIVLVVITIYNGVTPMGFYVATIFQETGSNVSPNISAVIVGSVQFIGALIGAYLVERVGRKV